MLIEHVILVLGSTNDDEGNLSTQALERCDLGFKLYQSLPNAKIMTTGGQGTFNTTDIPHCEITKLHLANQGVPAADLLPCAVSVHTVEDALSSKQQLSAYEYQHLHIVTSDFHLQRVQRIFNVEFAGQSIHFHGSETHLPQKVLANLVAHEQRALARLREKYTQSSSCQ